MVKRKRNFFEKSAVNSVIEFKNGYHNLCKNLEEDGNLPEEARIRCGERIEQVVLVLMSVAVGIDRSELSTSSTLTSPTSASSSNKRRALCLSPPARQEPLEENIAAPLEDAVPDPLRPSVEQRVETPGKLNEVKTYARALGAVRGIGGGVGNIRRLTSASPKISRKNQRRLKRARRDAASYQSNKRAVEQDSSDWTDENDDSDIFCRLDDCEADVNTAFLEQPDDFYALSEEHKASNVTPSQRQEPPEGNLTNASPPQAALLIDPKHVLTPLQPQSGNEGQPKQHITGPCSVVSRKKNFGLKVTRGRGGSFRNNNMLFSASRKMSGRKLPFCTRARRDAAPYQSKQRTPGEDDGDWSDVNVESTNAGHVNELMVDFNATFREQPKDLSDEDRDHESLYEIIQKILDPDEWNLGPKNKVVRKLFRSKEVKTKIRDYLLEHVRFGFHIEKSKGGLNKFLREIVDCILPSGDPRRKVVIDYLRNCAVQTSRSFGKVVQLMLEVHEKYCSEECVRTGSLGRFGT